MKHSSLSQIDMPAAENNDVIQMSDDYSVESVNGAHVNGAQWRSEDRRSGDRRMGDRRKDHRTASEWRGVERRKGERRTGDRRTGDRRLLNIGQAILLASLSVVLNPAEKTSTPHKQDLFQLSLGQKSASAQASVPLGEGSDLEIGGYGSEAGKFNQLRDMAFDGQNNLYVLEGFYEEPSTRVVSGNGRIQKFNAQGGYLGQISLRNDAMGANALGDKNDPQRIAVTSQGEVFVTQPVAGVVQQFDTAGKFVRSISVPQAFAITTQNVGGQEQVVVLGSRRVLDPNKGWIWLGGDKLYRIRPGATTAEAVTLSQPLSQTADMTSDAAGNLYMVAAVNQIYKFDASGRLLRTVGGGTNARYEDGSELLHTIAVDSRGNVYTMTWGNPGLVTRFRCEFQHHHTASGSVQVG
jgi:sugar lactone lactonase YvrE